MNLQTIHDLRFTIHELDPVHGVEQIFSLRVDAHSELFTLATQTLLQFGGALARPRGIRNDHHGKLSLDHRLIDVNNTTVRGSQYLRYTGDDAGMIDTKHRNDHSVGRAFASISAGAAA